MGDEDGTGQALTAPAVARNREPILAVLRRVLPAAGSVLELASGTGEHAVHFAAALPGLHWQPSDPDAQARASIAAHLRACAVTNVAAPLALDATSPSAWPAAPRQAVICINMIHIAPWPAALGLMAGAARVLAPEGVLVLYGPFREAGRPLAPGNAGFDASLRARDPAWGLREVEAVAAAAARHGLVLAERVAMPADNLCLILRRAA